MQQDPAVVGVPIDLPADYRALLVVIIILVPQGILG
jgi:hypothetical protein